MPPSNSDFQIDCGLVARGVSRERYHKVGIVKTTLRQLEGEVGATIPHILAECEARGLPREEALEIIDRLRVFGEVYQPREGVLRTTGR